MIEVLRNGNVKIMNANVLEKTTNFAGERKTVKKRNGGSFITNERSFCVILDDPEIAEELIKDGWNISVRPATDEYPEPSYLLSVTVRFDVLPPKIRMIENGKAVILTEDSVGTLDSAPVDTWDLVIRPRHWVSDEDGATHVKAYLKSMRVYLEADDFGDFDTDGEEEALPFD